MNILSRIWPWSKIQRLEEEVENQRFYHSKTSDFAAQCLAYIDHLEPGVQHFRFNGRLYCMGVDYCNEVICVPNPRMNIKVEGLEL